MIKNNLWFLTKRYFFIFFLLIVQTSFFKGLGSPWMYINFLLILMILWIVRDGLEDGLRYILPGAFFLDLLTGSYFGLILIVFFVTAYVLNLVYLYLFTNNSLVSLLILGVFAVWLYSLVFVSINNLLNWLNIIERNIVLDTNYWVGLVWQTLFTFIILFDIYIYKGFLSRNRENII